MARITGMVKRRCRVCRRVFQINMANVRQGSGKTCGAVCQGKARTRAAIALLRWRRCVACGRSFRVATKNYSRVGAPDTQRLCSTTCQKAARYRRGRKARKLSVREAAYLAGFMDGEGSVMIVARKRGDGGHMRISAANTDLSVLRWMVKVTGVGRTYRQRDASRRNKASWAWRCHGDGAESVLKQIQPYLHIKRVQTRLALWFQSRLRTPALKADRTWQTTALTQMRRLNRRGIGR